MSACYIMWQWRSFCVYFSLTQETKGQDLLLSAATVLIIFESVSYTTNFIPL